MNAGIIAGKCLEAISGITDDEVSAFTQAIISAKTVFVFGVGRSGLVAQMFAVRLVQLGLRVNFIGDMTTPLISKDDLVFLVSNSGDTMSVVKTAEIAGRIGTPVISLTGSKDNDLAQISTQSMIISGKGNDGNSTPLGTVFEDAAILFLDGIIPELMTRLGSSEEDMRARHAIWV